MFKNEYQGGPYVDVFSGHGKDPGGPWKFIGASNIQRMYDDELKSYVFVLEGTTSTTKMQLPKDARQSLCLTQRFLVIQVLIAHRTDFSVEINLTDTTNSKHRIFMSTSQRDIAVSPLLAKVPLFMIKRNIWVSLCLDLVSFVGELWPKQSFHQLDCLVISASCRLARVCTLKKGPADSSDDCEVYGIPREPGETKHEPLPPPVQLPASVPSVCQILNVSKLRLIEWKCKASPHSLNRDSSAGSSSRENSAEVPRSAPVSASAAAVRHRRSGSEPSGPILEPHPPPGESRSDSRRRRRVRLKAGGSSSAGKEAESSRTADLAHRSSAGSERRVEDLVATGHRLEGETRPPPPVRKKSGVYFFSSQPKAAAPDMTNISTDGESETGAVRPQKSSLMPQKAGDSPQHRTKNAAKSPASSLAEGNKRVALLRRSLRELSQSMLQQRMAATQKQQSHRSNLNLDHLTPGDMSDSFEAQMLLNMKAENEEDEEEEPPPQQQRQRATQHFPTGSKLQPTMAASKRQSRHANPEPSRGEEEEESTHLPIHGRLHLTDDSSDGEEMSTGRSTGRGAPPGPADSLYYLQEMQMCWPGKGGGLGTMRLSQETMPIEPVSASPLPPPSGLKASGHGSVSDPQEKEERLELLYDPVLNCYYDPQSSKYYELL